MNCKAQIEVLETKFLAKQNGHKEKQEKGNCLKKEETHQERMIQ